MESNLVHDVAYDLYGRRIATCSSDQRIKVWIKGSDGSWQRQAEWKAHYGPVWRVTFAHPEFGQIIASCSFDHNVLIWEEQEGVDDKGRVVSRWHQRAQLSDARESVNEIKFAPRHMGLKIAAGSADGHVRVYEATDATSLAHWEFSDEFEAEPASSGGVACLAWTTSPFDTAMMVVGGGSGMAKVWGYSPAARRWLAMLELKGHTGRVQDVAWAPNVGRSYHLIATCGGEGAVAVWKLQPDSTADYVPAASATAVSSSSGNNTTSGGEAGTGGSSWAVKKLPGSSAEALVAAVFDDHNALPVWRVEWNVTGTVLASSGDDGFLRLRKQTAVGSSEWTTTASLEMSAGPQLAPAPAAVPGAATPVQGPAGVSASPAAPHYEPTPQHQQHGIAAGGMLPMQPYYQHPSQQLPAAAGPFHPRAMAMMSGHQGFGGHSPGPMTAHQAPMMGTAAYGYTGIRPGSGMLGGGALGIPAEWR